MRTWRETLLGSNEVRIEGKCQSFSHRDLEDLGDETEEVRIHINKLLKIDMLYAAFVFNIF